MTFAGDDGGAKGQAYRLAIELEEEEDEKVATATNRFRFRYPDELGVWRHRQTDTLIKLPRVVERLQRGTAMAPTLREVRLADGERIAVLDFIVEVPKAGLPGGKPSSGCLGRIGGAYAHHCLRRQRVLPPDRATFLPGRRRLQWQASPPRRQVDELKKKVARYERERGALEASHPKRERYSEQLRREIKRCWRKYQHRNRARAHLASNVLLLLTRVHGCSLLSMESLRTLKSAARPNVSLSERTQ